MSPRMLTGLYLLEMLLQNNTFFILRMMTMQHFYTGEILGFFILFWSLIEVDISTSCWYPILKLVIEHKKLDWTVDFF